MYEEIHTCVTKVESSISPERLMGGKIRFYDWIGFLWHYYSLEIFPVVLIEVGVFYL